MCFASAVVRNKLKSLNFKINLKFILLANEDSKSLNTLSSTYTQLIFLIYINSFQLP